MNNLPFELIDKILSYLDGLSLARSESVCRTWRSLHQQTQYNNLWKNVCREEFTSEALADITGCPLGKFDHGHDPEEDSVLEANVKWKEVYKECYRSWFIGKWPSLGTELRGHIGQVFDAKFSGDRVVTCGADSTVRIWDSWTGSCIKILKEHSQDVHCLALRRKFGVSSHDDCPHDLIVSGSEDHSVCIWDLGNKVCIRRFHHDSRIISVAVQDSIVVAGSGNSTAVIWDINQDNDLALCTVHTEDWIRHVGFWNGFIVTITEKNMLDFWSAESGEHIASDINYHRNMNISSVVLRGDRTLTLSYCGKLTAWQHRLVDGEIDFSVLRCYTIIAAGIAGILEGTCMAIYGCLVAVGTKHGMINVYHLEKDWDKQFQFIHTIVHSYGSSFNSIDISDDGTGPALLTTGQDGVVRVERWFPWPWER